MYIYYCCLFVHIFAQSNDYIFKHYGRLFTHISAYIHILLGLFYEKVERVLMLHLPAAVSLVNLFRDAGAH